MSAINITPLVVSDPDLVTAITEMEEQDEASRGQQVEALAAFDGQRIRVHLDGRKMSVPGRLNGHTLHTNWGLELDLSKENVVQVDLKNADTGRWIVAASF